MTKMAAAALALSRARWQDYAELTRPRIALLVLFTVGVGAFLARPQAPDWLQILHALAGTALVAAGASALNQFLERHTDGLMRRTETRPLPAARLQPAEVLALGLLLSGTGLCYLGLTLRHPLAAAIAALTLVSYVLLYTPLKRITTLNTLVGAVPGALPPVIGWSAVTGRVDGEAVVLFLILFLWQVPHFLAIAWIHREDYGRAGLRMLPVVDTQGGMTARQMVVYCLALVAVSLMPVLLRQAGWLYALAAVVMGGLFLRACWGFLRERSLAQARGVLHASLLYLPAIFGLLILERIIWLSAFGLYLTASP